MDAKVKALGQSELTLETTHPDRLAKFYKEIFVLLRCGLIDNQTLRRSTDHVFI